MAAKFSTLFVVFFGLVVMGKGEVFTALAHMKELILLEQRLLTELEIYLNEYPETPAKFHRFVDEVITHTSFINGDVETFLGHPVNAFLLVRRFRGKWAKLGSYLNKQDEGSGKLYLILN